MFADLSSEVPPSPRWHRQHIPLWGVYLPGVLHWPHELCAANQCPGALCIQNRSPSLFVLSSPWQTPNDRKLRLKVYRSVQEMFSLVFLSLLILLNRTQIKYFFSFFLLTTRIIGKIFSLCLCVTRFTISRKNHLFSDPQTSSVSSSVSVSD